MDDRKEGRAHLPGDGDNWFADVSKNREGVEAGVYRKKSDTSIAVPLGPHSRVLQTEIDAIRQCVHKAQDHGHYNNIRICSDSRAAITTLDESVTISMLVWECFEALNKLAEDIQVTVLSPRQTRTGPFRQTISSYTIVRTLSCGTNVSCVLRS